jgi:hypothetical protein
VFAPVVELQLFALLGLVPEHWLDVVQVLFELQLFGWQTFVEEQVLFALFPDVPKLHPQVLFVMH